MAAGIGGGHLMIRVGTAGYDQALADGGRVLTMGERTMRGMVGIDDSADDDTLQSWVDRGVELALSEPPKKPKTAAEPA
jgi:hypothetical protein